MGLEKFINEHLNSTQKPQHLREGQWLMTDLFNENPNLYDMIDGTEADCFYDDSRVKYFWDMVMQNWI